MALFGGLGWSRISLLYILLRFDKIYIARIAPPARYLLLELTARQPFGKGFETAVPG